MRHADLPALLLRLQGSLRTQLDMKNEGLNWAQRANVALGAARGLAYLHDEAEPPVRLLFLSDCVLHAPSLPDSKAICTRATGHTC